MDSNETHRNVGNSEIEAERRQKRIDLAAAHRTAVMHGFNEGIFNHFTARVPGYSDRYYQIPFGLHWSEVTASCFMEVGYDGRLHVGDGIIEQSCFHIHAPIHKGVSHADTVLHTHMPFCSALARLEDPRILPLGATELRMMIRAGYDNGFHTVASLADGELLAEKIGDAEIFIMSNHGVNVVAKSVPKAYDLLYYAERAAQVQLYAMWTGQPLKTLPEHVIKRTTDFYKKGDDYTYGGRDASEWHFDALKRILDKREPDYKS